MSRKLGFGVVGIGGAGLNHLKSIKQLDQARVVAINTRNKETGHKVSQANDCKFYAHFDELLNDSEVDAVVLTNPPEANYGYIIKAAQAKKHIIAEKPISTTTEQAREIIKVCEENGVTLAIIFQHRFDSASLYVKQLLEQNQLGRIRMITVHLPWYRGNDYYNVEWRRTKKLSGGGVLMIQAIHYIDLMLWFAGEVDKVTGFTATLGHEGIEVEDTAVASVKFKSGALGSVSATTCALPGYSQSMEIYAEKGSVIIRDDKITDIHVNSILNHPKELFHQGAGETTAVNDPTAISLDSLISQYEDFIHSVVNHKAPIADGKEGLKVVELIETIYSGQK